MKTWKSDPSVIAPEAVVPLQWGHVDEDVEESPNPIRRPPISKLQWGHVDEDVEEWAAVEVARALTGASMGPRR